MVGGELLLVLEAERGGMLEQQWRRIELALEQELEEVGTRQAGAAIGRGACRRRPHAGRRSARR
eukprot:scaffold17418_cov66-Phaeocystis_antarctica.AAC.2